MLKAGEEDIEAVDLGTRGPGEQRLTTSSYTVTPNDHQPDQRTHPNDHHHQHSPPPMATTRTTFVTHGGNTQAQTRTGSGGNNPFQHMSPKKIKVIPENRKGQLNTGYLATVPGVLKMAQMIVGFVAFILAICADRRSASTGWTEHICFETMIVVAVLLLAYVVFPHLSIDDQRTHDGLIVVELLFYGINTFFFFIAIWLMVHLAASWTAEGRGAAIMCAVLCVALVILFAAETYLKYRAWRGQDVLAKRPKGNTATNYSSSQHSPGVPPPPTHKQQQHYSSDGGQNEHVVV